MQLAGRAPPTKVWVREGRMETLKLLNQLSNYHYDQHLVVWHLLQAMVADRDGRQDEVISRLFERELVKDRLVESGLVRN